MRAGGGKQKGAQYERDVCVALSLWISHGKQKDLFWRSAMSGGRATVGKRKGDDLASHAGDISATDKLGHVLTDHFYVECKRYADLNLAAFIAKDAGQLAKFWQVAKREALTHGKIPMLIVREDRADTWLIVPNAAQLTRGIGHTFNFNPHAALARVYKSGCDIYLFDAVVLKQYNVPARFSAHNGPFLKPGEFARISNAKSIISPDPALSRVRLTQEKPKERQSPWNRDLGRRYEGTRMRAMQGDKCLGDDNVEINIRVRADKSESRGSKHK